MKYKHIKQRLTGEQGNGGSEGNGKIKQKFIIKSLHLNKISNQKNPQVEGIKCIPEGQKYGVGLARVGGRNL